MTLITFKRGKPVLRGDKVGTEQACCCSPEICFAPFEWRIVDENGNVWYSGDIDKDDNGLLRLRDFPADCKAIEPPYLYLAASANLRLEVFGCNGGQWDLLAGPYHRAFQGCGEVDMFCLFDNPADNLNFPGSWESPVGCRCQYDSVTGEIVLQDPNDPESPCVPCPSSFTTSPGPGLGHLTSGRAVTFTGAVDGEGSNLANWADADGNSPASSLPDANSDIVLAASLTSWYDPQWDWVPTVKSVTINSGCRLAVFMNAVNLTAMGGASVEEKTCRNFFNNPQDVIINLTGTGTFNDAFNYAIINGDCTFNGGANFDTGTITGTCVLNGDFANFGTINGNCTFSDTAANQGGSGAPSVGTITGDCTFNGNSRNRGIITGDCTFNGTSFNSGTITATALCTFNVNAYNMDEGTIDGDCEFNGTSRNFGNIDGDCEFNVSSYNETYGTERILGDCTFNNTAYNGGRIQGNATFYDSSRMEDVTGKSRVTIDAIFYDSATLEGGTVDIGTFRDDSRMTGGVVLSLARFEGNSRFEGGTLNPTDVGFVGNSCMAGGTVTNATFSGTASMAGGTVTGTATFDGDSRMEDGTASNNATFNDTSRMTGGSVGGSATFNATSRMEGGTVTGTATFSGGCYAGGTAGTFVPAQPPACP